MMCILVYFSMAVYTSTEIVFCLSCVGNNYSCVENMWKEKIYTMHTYVQAVVELAHRKEREVANHVICGQRS